MKRTIVAILATALLAGQSATWATGSHWHYVKPPVVKPPIVTPPPVSPPVVTPPPPTVTPPTGGQVAPSPTPEQPSGGGNGPGLAGWIAVGVVVAYFTAVVRSHMAWCAEDDKKPARERKCYRPLRDGMPQ